MEPTVVDTGQSKQMIPAVTNSQLNINKIPTTSHEPEIPSSNTRTGIVDEVNRPSIVNDEQMLTLNFPQLLQYLNTLPDTEQWQTMQLLRNVQTHRFSNDQQDKSDTGKAINSVRVYTETKHEDLHARSEVAHGTQRKVPLLPIANCQGSKSVIMLEDQSVLPHTDLNQACDEEKQLKEGDYESRPSQKVKTNSYWQKLMLQAAYVQQSANVQVYNSQSDIANIHKENVGQDTVPNKQSIESELLELIKRANGTPDGGHRALEALGDMKVSEASELRKPVYRTVDDAKTVEVRSAVRLPNSHSMGQQTGDKLEEVNLSKETCKGTIAEADQMPLTCTTPGQQVVKSSAGCGPLTHMARQKYECQEGEPPKSDGGHSQQQEILFLPQAKLILETSSDAHSLVPHLRKPIEDHFFQHVFQPQTSSDIVSQTPQIQAGQVYTTQQVNQFDISNQTPQSQMIMAQPIETERLFQPVNMLQVMQPVNEAVVTQPSNEITIDQQSDSRVVIPIEAAGPQSEQVAESQSAELQGSRIPSIQLQGVGTQNAQVQDERKKNVLLQVSAEQLQTVRIPYNILGVAQHQILQVSV